MGLRVGSCCGCCSVRTGALIIAILQLIGSVMSVIVFSVLLALIQNVDKFSSDPQRSSWWSTTPDPFGYVHQSDTSSNAEATEVAVAILTIIYSVVLGAVALNLLFSILLLVGIVQNKPNMVLSWIVYTAILFGFGVLATFISLFIASAAYKGGAGFVAIILFQSLISLGIQFYFIVVVRSFHLSLTVVPYDHMPIVEAENMAGDSMNVTISTPPSYASEMTKHTTSSPYDGPNALPPPYASVNKQSAA